MSIVGFTNQELANKVGGAAFLCPIAYLHWVEVPVIRMAVLLHIDDVRRFFYSIFLKSSQCHLISFIVVHIV